MTTNRFLSQSGVAPPFDDVTIDYSSGVLALPSGNTFDDVTTRLISDTVITMSSEIKYSPASGSVNILTETSGWIGMNFEDRFSPADMPQLSVWFQSRAGGMRDAAGDVLDEADSGNGVNSWNSAVSGHNIISQDNTTRPSFVHDSITVGRSTASFSGLVDELNLDTMPNLVGVTIFCLFKMTSASATSKYLVGNTSSAFNHNFYMFLNASEQIEFGYKSATSGGAFPTVTGSKVFGAGHPYTIVCGRRASNGHMSLFENGSGLSEAGNSSADIPMNSGWLNTVFSLGVGDGGTAGHFTGEIGEVLVFNSGLSDTDVGTVFEYFNEEFGISIA